MLLKPSHGWVTVSIGNFSDRASYLTDVPLDILDAFIDTYNSYQPAVITFDAEGWDYFVLVDRCTTYIIDYPYRADHEYLSSDNVKPQLFIEEIGKDDLAKEFIADIERDYHQWVNWSYDDDEDEILKRKIILDEKLLKLKSLIRN